jgi:urease accessory protein
MEEVETEETAGEEPSTCTENPKTRVIIANDKPGTTQHPPSLSFSSTASLHTLLLLSDSALPLGSFAFSSGLESFLAHRRLSKTSKASFNLFLRLSLSSLASTALPYVLAAYRHPGSIEDLNNDFDASTPCTVARRASIAQGRALLSVFERSFATHMTSDASKASGHDTIEHLKQFSARMKSSNKQEMAPNAHFPPLWGLITRILEVDEPAAAYMFLFGHARTLIGAAVRASELGPYQAQGELASNELRNLIEGLVAEYWNAEPSDAAQTVPAIDLWVGRHEKLYSRIFNS